MRAAADIEQARALVRDAGGEARIVAKIERHEAVDNLSGIIEAADVVMVARGDLGVEMGYAELTGLQKTIIHESRTRNRVVITATQMMESMIQNPVPTRAEVSDVANAVMDGTDARDAVGGDRRRALPGEGGARRWRRSSRARRSTSSRIRAARQRAPEGRVQGDRGGDRDGGHLHRQPHEGARHRGAHRIRRDAAVDVAHPLGHPRVRLHARTRRRAAA